MEAASTTTHSGRTGVSWSLTNSAHFGPELAGFLCCRLVSETADLWFGDVLTLFSPPWKSRFPATETAVGRDSVRMGQLFDRKPEHLVLAGPFGRQVG